MGTLLNRRRYMGGGSSLPYDAEIEYLEGDGASYIDTLVNMHEIVVTEYTIQFTSVSGIQVIFGVYTGDTSARAQIYLNGTQWKDYNVNNLRTTGYSNPANTTYVYTLTSKTKSEMSSDLTLYIFGRNPSASGPLPCRMKLYSMTMTSGGVLVRDYIPVRVGTIGYLYDKVSGQLFGNAGTGDFILGPDKIGGGKSLVINMLCGYSVERRAA